MRISYLSLLAMGCGGIAMPSSKGIHEEEDAAVPMPMPMPMACVATPSDWSQACVAASEAFRVEPISIDFKALLVRFRYANRSSTASWNYASVQMTADDPRISATRGGPDLYALSKCSTHDYAHGFTMKSPVPSGTKVRFTLAPMAANGMGISTCPDTPSATIEATVP